jgi:hypothetical protein
MQTIGHRKLLILKGDELAQPSKQLQHFAKAKMDRH